MAAEPGDVRMDAQAETPKYRQIVEGVCRDVQAGRLRKGGPLPSINRLSARHRIARDTVVKAYAALKAMGVVASAHGKGFFVATDHFTPALRLFVLFDAMTPYKEILYEGLRAESAGRAQIDIVFHHFNAALFAKLLGDARGRYGYYIVMPFPDPAATRALAAFDPARLLLLDILVDFPGKRCAEVLQSHDAGLERALGEALPRIRRYRSLTLVFPEDRHHPAVIKPAFRRFCRRNRVAHAVVETLEGPAIRRGHAYFVIEDGDLVRLIKACRRRSLKLGRDVGVVSYNDTPMKEVVQDGISVVSVDFAELGRKAARAALARESGGRVVVPTRFLSRDSL
jgi:DNA-binding transcriptional regulator YhcF (GntR family)